MIASYRLSNNTISTLRVICEQDPDVLLFHIRLLPGVILTHCLHYLWRVLWPPKGARLALIMLLSPLLSQFVTPRPRGEPSLSAWSDALTSTTASLTEPRQFDQSNPHRLRHSPETIQSARTSQYFAIANRCDDVCTQFNKTDSIIFTLGEPNVWRHGEK